jgi:hypothetical protein
MNTTTFDTHSFVKLMRERGFTEPQAEAVVQIVTQRHESDLQNAATKADLRELELRLKTEVETIPGALDKILHLRGVYYHWIDPKENAKKGRQIGVIAQEVEKVFPEAVMTDMSPASPLQGGTKMVAAGDLVAPLIEAVKELKADNDNLRAANDNEAAEIKALTARLDKCEAAKATHP